MGESKVTEPSKVSPYELSKTRLNHPIIPKVINNMVLHSASYETCCKPNILKLFCFDFKFKTYDGSRQVLVRLYR